MMPGGQPGLRWGLIGASTIARQRVIGAIRNNGSTVACVYSESAERGRAYAAEMSIPAVAVTVNDLLEQVDAVYVSTTNERHCAQVLASAAAGRHVLCEKPLAISISEADSMIEACRVRRVVLATNHHLRSNAALRAMCAHLQEGTIGRPLFARVFNAGYLPKALQGWRLHIFASGAGVTLDKLVHDVDTLRFVLGDDVVSVLASMQNSGMAASGVEDGVMGILRFGSGTLAQFHDAFSTPGGLTGLEIHGTEGSLLASNCLTGGAVGELQLRTATGTTAIAVEHEDPYTRVIRLFEQAIKAGSPPDCTGEDGKAALEVALAAINAARLGREIRLD